MPPKLVWLNIQKNESQPIKLPNVKQTTLTNEVFTIPNNYCSQSTQSKTNCSDTEAPLLHLWALRGFPRPLCGLRPLGSSSGCRIFHNGVMVDLCSFTMVVVPYCFSLLLVFLVHLQPPSLAGNQTKQAQQPPAPESSSNSQSHEWQRWRSWSRLWCKSRTLAPQLLAGRRKPSWEDKNNDSPRK